MVLRSGDSAEKEPWFIECGDDFRDRLVPFVLNVIARSRDLFPNGSIVPLTVSVHVFAAADNL